MFDKDEVIMMMNKLSKNFGFRRKLDECDGGLISVKSGGDVFAKYLQDKYKLPLNYVSTSLYDNEKGVIKSQFKLEVPRELLQNRSKKYMFIDDVYETGMTWDVLKSIFPNSYLTVLVYKGTKLRDDVVKGDFITSDIWVEFTW